MKPTRATASWTLLGWNLMTAAILALHGCATATTQGTDDQAAVKIEPAAADEGATQTRESVTQPSPIEQARRLREGEYRRALGQPPESETNAGERATPAHEYVMQASGSASQPSPREQALRLREEEDRRATTRAKDAKRFEHASAVVKGTQPPSFEPTSRPKDEEFERKEEYEAFITALESQVQMAKLSPPQRTETSSKSRSDSKSGCGGDLQARALLLLIILSIDPGLWPMVLAPGCY